MLWAEVEGEGSLAKIAQPITWLKALAAPLSPFRDSHSVLPWPAEDFRILFETLLEVHFGPSRARFECKNVSRAHGPCAGQSGNENCRPTAPFEDFYGERAAGSAQTRIARGSSCTFSFVPCTFSPLTSFLVRGRALYSAESLLSEA